MAVAAAGRRRRSEPLVDWRAEHPAGQRPAVPPEPEEESYAESTPTWIAGPAGNLYVRDTSVGAMGAVGEPARAAGIPCGPAWAGSRAGRRFAARASLSSAATSCR